MLDIRLSSDSSMYEYGLVYSCLDVEGDRSDFVYFFSRTPSFPDDLYNIKHGIVIV